MHDGSRFPDSQHYLLFTVQRRAPCGGIRSVFWHRVIILFLLPSLPSLFLLSSIFLFLFLVISYSFHNTQFPFSPLAPHDSYLFHGYATSSHLARPTLIQDPHFSATCSLLPILRITIARRHYDDRKPLRHFLGHHQQFPPQSEPLFASIISSLAFSHIPVFWSLFFSLRSPLIHLSSKNHWHIPVLSLSMFFLQLSLSTIHATPISSPIPLTSETIAFDKAHLWPHILHFIHPFARLSFLSVFVSFH